MDLTLSVLAIYAVLSLVVERIMELFSESWWCRVNKTRIDETKSKIADLQITINELAKKLAKDENQPLHSFQDERSKKKVQLMLLERNRVIAFLLIGTVSGIAISFVFNFVFDIGLFNLFGFDITKVGDSIVSGLIIGAGTKPTHDLIGVIEKVVKK
jgi:hypothetical protein